MEKQLRSKVNWLVRLMGLLGRKYWVRRIHHELSLAFQEGRISSETLHILDHRMKYAPTK